jgi:GAF domain-containing protein
MIRMGTSGQEQARRLSLESYQVLDTEAEAPFDELTQLATQLLGVSIALVGFIDSPRWWFKSRVGISLEQLPLEQSFCRYMLSTGQMLTVDDASIDPRFAQHPLVIDGPQIRAYAGVPLINDEGHLLGSLCALDTAPRHWQEADRVQMRLLADLVMARLELRRHQIELASTKQRLDHKARRWAACEQQLNQLARWMPTAIYQFRLSPSGVGEFPFASHAFQDLFGLSPKALNASAEPLFELLNANDREAMTQSVLACEKALSPWSMEFRCRLPDGRLEWFQGKSRPTMEPAWPLHPHL